MRYFLKNQGDRYVLYGSDDSKIASTSENPYGKLSKQNCDEIFGVVDVERLTEEIVTSHPDFKTEGFSDYQNGKLNGIIEGFNKAMEIQKDKLFTVEDMKEVFAKTIENLPSIESYTIMISDTEYRHSVMDKIYSKIIQSLQQPKEIEVSYIMACGNIDGCTEPDVECTCEIEPALDANGCLLLRKK